MMLILGGGEFVEEVQQVASDYSDEISQIVDWATGSITGAIVVTVILLAKFKAFPWQKGKG